MAHTKGFDPTSSPSTFPFDGNKDDNDDDAPQVPNPLHNISSSSVPPPTSGSTFIEDHYNLINIHIDSLTSLVDSLGGILHQLQVQQASIQAQKGAIQAYKWRCKLRRLSFALTFLHCLIRSHGYGLHFMFMYFGYFFMFLCFGYIYASSHFSML